ncbi:hypothetical protein D3C73_1575850 [compost metagenome]
MRCYSGDSEDLVDVHFHALKLESLQQCAAPLLERLFLALHVRLQLVVNAQGRGVLPSIHVIRGPRRNVNVQHVQPSKQPEH